MSNTANYTTTITQTEVEDLNISGLQIEDTSPVKANAKALVSSSSTVSTTKSASSNEDEEFQPIVYSEEELSVMREVRDKLVGEHKIDPSTIWPRVLALTTIINKLRVDETVKGYLKLKDGLALVNIKQCDEEVTKDVEAYLDKCYQPCGVDREGRRIMWIKGKDNPKPEEEQNWIQAGVLYWMAIHADNVSLRNGIHFVIDVTNKPKDEYGNAQKLQKINQCFPLRPQAILIAGTNRASRLVINGLIKVASVFAKAKVLKRIKFVTVDEAKESVSKENCPKYLGGNGGGIDDVVKWVKERLENFPVPQL